MMLSNIRVRPWLYNTDKIRVSDALNLILFAPICIELVAMWLLITCTKRGNNNGDQTHRPARNRTASAGPDDLGRGGNRLWRTPSARRRGDLRSEIQDDRGTAALAHDRPSRIALDSRYGAGRR